MKTSYWKLQNCSRAPNSQRQRNKRNARACNAFLRGRNALRLLCAWDWLALASFGSFSNLELLTLSLGGRNLCFLGLRISFFFNHISLTMGLIVVRYSSSIIGMAICFIKGKPEHSDKESQSPRDRNLLLLRLILFVSNLATTVLLLSGPNCVQNIIMLFAQCVSFNPLLFPFWYWNLIGFEILFCQLSQCLSGCNIHTVLLWGFFTLQYYFATGHDFSFTRIQWSAACISPFLSSLPPPSLSPISFIYLFSPSFFLFILFSLP